MDHLPGKIFPDLQICRHPDSGHKGFFLHVFRLQCGKMIFQIRIFRFFDQYG